VDAYALAVLEEYERREREREQSRVTPSLEAMLCGEQYFGLTTATPLQRAICRIAEGAPLGELAADPVVLKALGGAVPLAVAPLELLIIAAVRCAKSLIAAAIAIRATQTCQLNMLRSGEIPRFSILSLEKDNAKVVHGHVLGGLRSPGLKHIRVDDRQASEWRELIDETGADSVGSEFVWHPSGRPVEIRVVAGKRAGGSLVSRWSAGGVLDEAPRMVGSSDHVVNYDDARKAIIGRLLPGAQLLSIGSPWAPFGPVYEKVQSTFGKPTAECVTIRARGPDLNPFWWTPQRSEALKRSDLVAHRTDCEADFADIEEALFPDELLKLCCREHGEPIPRQAGHDYSAAIDPATRNNAWTLVVADSYRGRKRVVFARQWQGSSVKPLSPKAVLQEVAADCKSYGLDVVYTDQWSADANRDLAAGFGLMLSIDEMSTKEQVNAYTSIAAKMADGEIELPGDSLFRTDFKMVKRRTTQSGVAIVLVKTPDGRHADYAPATMRALRRWIADEVEQPPPPGTPERADYDDRQREDEEEREARAAATRPWWDR
jgi:hypothetical protein